MTALTDPHTVACRYCEAEMVINGVGEIMAPALGTCRGNRSGDGHQVHPEDKPVRPTSFNVDTLSPAIYEDDGVHAGHGDEGPAIHGVIVYHHSPTRKPKVARTVTVSYRDRTLVPFFTYYHDVRMVETF